MSITIYRGGIGSGKTVSLVRDLYPLRKTQILTNMTLNKKIFKNAKMLTLDDIKNYKNWEYKNITVVFDEIHTLMDSRKSGTNFNTMFSYWFLQSRKKGVEIRGTTQFLNQLELRVRNIIDYLIECNCYKRKNAISKYVDDKGIPTDFFIHQKLFNRDKQKYTRQEIFYANQYFYLYDTYEVIDFSNTPQNKKLTDICKYITTNIPEKYYERFYKMAKHFKRNVVSGVLA